MSTSNDDQTVHDELSFEQAMAQLEGLVAELERDDLGLEASLTCYEQGVALAKHCLERLDRAELKVRELSLRSSANGA